MHSTGMRIMSPTKRGLLVVLHFRYNNPAHFRHSHATESLLGSGLIKYFLVASVYLINEVFLHIYLYTQVLTFITAKVTTAICFQT